MIKMVRVLMNHFYFTLQPITENRYEIFDSSVYKIIQLTQLSIVLQTSYYHPN